MESATARSTPVRHGNRPWWRRVLMRPEPPVVDDPVTRLIADLRRLEGDVEELLADEQIIARGQRLQAVLIAYDLVLLDAARALDVPPPRRRAPLPRSDRVVLRAELAIAGLDW